MIELFAAYLRERFSPLVFGPAIGLHAAAALWAAPELHHGLFAASVAVAGFATALLLQFRLWDDLEDRERDRQSHPERVLARTRPTPFRAAFAFLTVLNVVLLAAAGSRLAVAGLVVLNVFFWIAYRRLRRELSERVWTYQVLLIKYPVFVGLLAASIGSPLPWRLAAAAIAVYLCACVYEALHDRRLPLGATS